MNKKNAFVRRILIVRTDRIGDVVLSLPVVSALRKSHPESYLAMLVQPAVREIVENHPDLNSVLFDGAEERGWFGFFRLVRRIRKETFDASLLLHPTSRLALVLILSRIRIRVGTGYRWYSFLFNKRVFEHRKTSIRHEAEYNLSLAGMLGADTKTVEFRIGVPESAKRNVEAFLREKRILKCRPLVVLHPGSRGSALDWPIHSFARLAEKLVDEAGACVVVSGGVEEMEMASRMVRPDSRRAVSAAGRFTLKELCTLLGRADLFIANSTGPLHLARAMNVEVIGFYPPLVPAGPRRWGPYGRMDSVLMPDLPECRTCRRGNCPEWNCMKRISLEEAWRLVTKKLRGMGYSIRGAGTAFQNGAVER